MNNPITNRQRRIFPYVLPVIIVTFLISIAAIAYYDREKKQVLDNIQNKLQLVSELKSQQIQTWLEERIADATSDIKSEYFIEAITAYANLYTKGQIYTPQSINLYSRLQKRLKLLKAEGNFEDVFITDTAFNIIINSENINKPFLFTETIESARIVLRKGETQLTNFYYNPAESHTHMDIISIVRFSESLTAALIYFRVNPDSFLYPYLDSWPYPSKTSETLLITQKDDSVIFISKLQNWKNETGKHLAIDFKQTEVPAVKAAMGTKGFVEGIDYTGENVYAYLSKIEGTDWFLVTKVDRNEISEKLSPILITTIGYSLLIILFTSSLFFFFFSIKTNKLNKKILQAQKEFYTSLYSIADGVITTDQHGKIRIMNKSACLLLDWTDEEVQGKNIDEVLWLFDENSVETRVNPVLTVLNSKLLTLDSKHFFLINRKGEKKAVTTTASPIYDETNKIIGVVLTLKDQTEEQSRKLELETHRQKLIMLLSNLPGMAYSCLNDDNWTMEFVSEGCLKLTGYLPKELIGNTEISYASVIRENYRPKVWEMVQQAIDNRSSFILEYEINCKNGDKKWVWEQGQGIFSDDGNLIRLEGFITDITVQKRAKEILEESERDLKIIIESSPLAMALADNEHNVIYLNKTFIETFGYNEKDIPNLTYWWNLAYPDPIYRENLKKSWIAAFDKANKSSSQISPLEVNVQCKDGSYKHILLKSSVIDNRNITIFQDISDRVLAENALKANEKKYRQLHESMTEAFVMVNLEGHILEFNEVYRSLLGYTKDELLGMDFRKITPEKWIEPEEEIITNQILIRGSSEIFEKEYIRKDGTVFPVELRAFLITNEIGEPESMWAIVRDITYRKQTEKALELIAGEGISKQGENSFSESMVLFVSKTFGVEQVLFGEYIAREDSVKSIAVCSGGEIVPNISYQLKDTPCENVINQKNCFYPKKIRLQFPKDLLLSEMKAESYIGIPLWNSQGNAIGIIALIDTKPMNESNQMNAILSIFTSRAAMEIERAKSDKELRNNIKRFVQVAENAQEWIWEVNAEGLYTYSSPMIYNILGYTPEEVVNKNYFFDFFHPDEKEQLKSQAFEAFKNLKPVTAFANRNIHKNGKVVNLSTNGVPIIDDHGYLIGYRGVDVDNTKQKLTEETLRFIAERSWEVRGESFFNALASYIGRVTQVNYVIIGEIDSAHENSQSLAFYSKGSIIENYQYKLDSTPCKNLLEDSFYYVNEGLQTQFADNTLIKEMGAVSYFGVPLYSYTGELTGQIAILDTKPIEYPETIQMILQLVSARAAAEINQMNAEIQLRKSEEKFKIISQISNDYLFESKVFENGNFELIWVGGAFQSISGYTMSEYKAAGGWRALLHPDDIAEDNLNIEKLMHGESVVAEARTYHKNKTTHWVRSHAHPIIDENNGQLIGIIGAVEDISDRKNSEEALKESERRMKTLMGNLPGMAYRCKNDHDWTKEFVSEGCFELTGYKPDDLVGNKTVSFNSLILPKYRDYLWEKWQRLLPLHEKFQDEYEIRTADGSIKWIWEQGQGVYDENGNVIALEGFYTDVTTRKQSEIIQTIQYNIANAIVETKDLSLLLGVIRRELDKLLDTTNFYVALYNSETGMLKSDVFKDEKDEILEWPAYKSLTGFVIQERKPVLILKKDMQKMVDQGDLNLLGTLSEIWMGVPIENEGKVYGVIAVQNYDNENAYNHTSLNFLEIIANQLSIFIKNQEAQEATTRMTKAVVQSPASIIITDIEGNIQYVNPKFEEVTGYTAEEVQGKNPRFLNSGMQSKEFYRQMWSTILSGQDWHGEFHNLRKNGELFWENALLSPILNDADEIVQFISVKEDITEKKKILDELVIAKEHAEENDRLKSAFLANMSHEIRTPLNGILGFTKMLTEGDPSPQQKEQFISIIDSSSERLLSVVNDILDISLIQSNQIKLFPEPFGINKFIEELLTFYETVQAEKIRKIKLFIDIPQTIQKLIITADRNRLYQIFKNLIDNSFKFTSEGEISFGYKVLSDNQIIFFVKDTGIGISEEKQKAIFEAFQQADETTPVLFGGTGLGLSIASGLLARMNGEIWVESKIGHGACFNFSIPFTSTLKETKAVKIRTNNSTTNFSGLKVLIVEDDDSGAQYLFEIFKTKGAEVFFAGSAEEAIQMVDTDEPQLIMMDIRLPGMSGLEATTIIKAKKPHIPIMAQTAFAMYGDAEKAINAGCDAYISKPINPLLLFEKLKKIL
ncbi:MAG: PAS domain S-box protein [Bacteroidales bacterium]|nr:PAS domain S-box protein [Bacteroidales bacterium]